MLTGLIALAAPALHSRDLAPAEPQAYKRMPEPKKRPLPDSIDREAIQLTVIKRERRAAKARRDAAAQAASYYRIHT
jgi:hypothetical protein